RDPGGQQDCVVEGGNACATGESGGRRQGSAAPPARAEREGPQLRVVGDGDGEVLVRLLRESMRGASTTV
ncbi:MAG: hypothetical protein L0G49_03015, partial [Luteococcus sp.]|uniref:hypothetical protein n=1 Tax=Luteococcus sp. TaxID=1969402 RepID=UPI002649F689